MLMISNEDVIEQILASSSMQSYQFRNHLMTLCKTCASYLITKLWIEKSGQKLNLIY